MQAFRVVLREATFGELYVDGHRPTEGQHVFASIQSLSQLDADQFPADFFDVVVIDEFHHAAAATYKRLLDHIRPKELIGLTATPERADGQAILDRFDGRIAAEIRIWEALDRGLLCPFQYFGIADGTDLSHVRWSRRGYDTTELQNLYTANDARVQLVLSRRSSARSQTPDGIRKLCVFPFLREPWIRLRADPGIPGFLIVINSLDSGLHRSDGLLRDHQS